MAANAERPTLNAQRRIICIQYSAFGVGRSMFTVSK